MNYDSWPTTNAIAYMFAHFMFSNVLNICAIQTYKHTSQDSHLTFMMCAREWKNKLVFQRRWCHQCWHTFIIDLAVRPLFAFQHLVREQRRGGHLLTAVQLAARVWGGIVFQTQEKLAKFGAQHLFHGVAVAVVCFWSTAIPTVSLLSVVFFFSGMPSSQSNFRVQLGTLWNFIADLRRKRLQDNEPCALWLQLMVPLYKRLFGNDSVPLVGSISLSTSQNPRCKSWRDLHFLDRVLMHGNFRW